MKDFVNTLTDLIMENEKERLDHIMYEVAQKIQGDMIAVTYNVIDAYYEDYTHEDGRKYIRTDEYKHPHGKGGKFRYKKKKEWSSNRRKDISLRSAIKAQNSGQPAIGVCRPLDDMYGYQAGVQFDESYFENAMRHSIKGINEWDIVDNFLQGVHGMVATSKGRIIPTTTPSAGLVLYDYLHAYKPRFDRHYKNACKKFGK